MADPRQATADPDFPDFDPKKAVIPKGSTLNRFRAIIRRNKPQIVSGSGIKIVQVTQDGTFLAIDADEVTLNVCIGGVSVSKTFYCKRAAGS